MSAIMLRGERQESLTLDGIAPDHLARYRFAAEKLISIDGCTSHVLDIACGNGYGSSILAAAGHTVHGVDADWDAIVSALAAYSGERTRFTHARIEDVVLDDAPFDSAVCFETLEHLPNPRLCLELIHRSLIGDGALIASVPNQLVVPYSEDKFPFHMRHYTRDQFETLLEDSGFMVELWFTQVDKWEDNSVQPGSHGRTLIAVAMAI